MNPFDLPGPQFLLFYLVLSITVLLVLARVRRARESEFVLSPKVDLSDPYLIAYLRGGKNETLRVATVSLIDRGLISVIDTELHTKNEASLKIVQRPIERKLLEKFLIQDEATSIFNDKTLEATCQEYINNLSALGALPDKATNARRTQLFLVSAAVLGSIAGIKIWVALSRGRHNILFLILLAIVSLLISLGVCYPFRTARGDTLLEDLKNLFSSLKDRAATLRPGGSTSEVALVAAVFGLATLPAENFSYTKSLYPKAATSSSCGSSCGSSSCGSSCGGGGCGGGCGGCGG